MIIDDLKSSLGKVDPDLNKRLEFYDKKFN
jgi:DNA polymerase I